MKNHARMVAAAACLLPLLAFAQANKPAAPVEVTNGSGNPVPITGTVTLSNPASGNVTVANTMANPVPSRAADNPVFKAWGTRAYAGPTSAKTINVPADKYLVITSATGFTNSADGYQFVIAFTNGNQIQGKVLPIESTRKGPWFYTRVEQLHVVADPGTVVTLSAESTASPDYGGYNLDLAGYFVDKP